MMAFQAVLTAILQKQESHGSNTALLPLCQAAADPGSRVQFAVKLLIRKRSYHYGLEKK